MSRRFLLPGGVLLLTGAMLLAWGLALGPPVQPLIAAVFFLTAPGAALVGLTERFGVAALLSLVLSLSIAVDIVSTTALRYTPWWGPGAVLFVLCLLCSSCAGVQVWWGLRPRRVG